MIAYTLIRSNRKTVGLQIKDGKLVVRAPHRLPRASIDAVVEKHSEWIKSHLAKSQVAEGVQKLTQKERDALVAQAKKAIPARVAYYASLLGVEYGRITIRMQKTRWGSCSSKGNLNFNCLLMLVPPEVLDSVVVHELCHRKHMNHSAAFYAWLSRVLPNHKELRKYLHTAPVPRVEEE